jgi:branched-chain amino acid transport system substrate-binding protein
VFALFGYIGTPTSLAALPLAVKDKVPFIAPFTGADVAARAVPQERVPPARLVQRRDGADGEAAHHLGLKKIAVFYQNDAYGKAGLDGVTLALSQLQLKPVALATVERNSVDVARGGEGPVAARPDAVVQIGAYKACAAFIREARKAGYGGTFFNVSFVGTQALADELGKEPRA